MCDVNYTRDRRLSVELVGKMFEGEGVNCGRDSVNGETVHLMHNAVAVGEDGCLGNPFKLSDPDTDGLHDIEVNGKTVARSVPRERSVELFEAVFVAKLRDDAAFRDYVTGLAGKPLNCWCQSRGTLGDACHAEVIAAWAMLLACEDVSFE
jgi:hypothetical protein